MNDTLAAGAIIIFGNFKNNMYDYISLGKERESDMLEFNFSNYSRLSTCSFNCTLFVYDIKQDGLPKHSDILTPALEIKNLSMDSDSFSRSPSGM